MIRDKEHLALVRMLPCAMGGKGKVEACHIRKGTDGAMGMKPSDCYVIPLSQEKHAEQHRVGELSFWGGHDKIEEAKGLALRLYASKDIFEAQRELIKWRQSTL